MSKKQVQEEIIDQLNECEPLSLPELEERTTANPDQLMAALLPLLQNGKVKFTPELTLLAAQRPA